VLPAYIAEGWSKDPRADMQRHKINLEVQTCSYFLIKKIKIDLKQELNILALNQDSRDTNEYLFGQFLQPI
jgi:hypothetical protein